MIKKSILYIYVILVLNACNCSKISEKKDYNQANNFSTIELKSECPDDGICTLKIYENKGLSIKTDNTGKIYYEFEENKELNVIHFEYKRNVPDDLQDASYREEIVFELKNSISEINLENSDLKTAKVIFGKHCFCRNDAGFHLVNEGKLKVFQNNGNLTFELNFKVNTVSNHVVSEIRGILK